ncbi:hypothetical protein ACJJTC_004713 [Scirpophaga incertulas]
MTNIVTLVFLILVSVSEICSATYRSRNRRALVFAGEAEPYDVLEVEKYIVGEFGARACVFERVCAHYAARAHAQPKPQMDWPDVFSQYKRSPDQAKELFLLSVFLGDIVGSPQLCHQLGKRRGCDEQQLLGLNLPYAVNRHQRGPQRSQ